MPRVKDLTHDLGKLSSKEIAEGSKAVQRISSFRKTAFDPVGWFCWTLLCLFLLIQVGFLVWIA